MRRSAPPRPPAYAATKPALVPGVGAWFGSLAVLGVIVSALLAPGTDPTRLLFAGLVWGATGAALGLSVRAGDVRPRGRRRW